MNSVLELVKPNHDTVSCLNLIESKIEAFSEMSSSERAFLTDLVIKYNPSKILEIGVSRGASSCLLLNAIQDNHNARLYSIDLNNNLYTDCSLKTGYLVEQFPEFKKRWKLYTGNMAYKFLDEIGDGIDLCLIDTAHVLPGEILDILMVLPYLKDDAILIFHDTNLHTAQDEDKSWQKVRDYSYTNNLLMSSIYGKKFLQDNFDNSPHWCNVHFSNIGAIQICKETKERLFEIFNLLTIPWFYRPDKLNLIELSSFIEKHYGTYWANYYNRVVCFQLDYVENKEDLLIHKQTDEPTPIDNEVVVLDESPKYQQKRNTLTSFIQSVFSVKNEYSSSNKHKVLSFLGIKIKFNVKNKEKE